MRPTSRRVLLSAAVVTVAGCADLLGIDEFTDASGGAGTTGTAGAAGTGTATSTGTATGAGGDGGEPGAPLWSARYGDDGVDSAAGVAVTSEGSIAIAGDFTSSIDFGGGPITNTHVTGRDAFVAMLQSDGSHRWADHLSGANEEVIESVAMDGANNVLVAGWFAAELYPPGDAQHFDSLGDDDVFFMKLDAAGDYLWGYRPLSSSGKAERATGIAAAANHDVVVVGHFEDWIEFDGDVHTAAANHGPDNAFLAALDAGGSDLWSDQFGVWGHQQPADVTALADGGVIVVGNCSGGVTDQIDCLAPTDVFVARYDATPSFDWATVHGDGATEHPHAVASSGDEFVVVGDFESKINFDPNPAGELTSHGSLDMFVAKLRTDQTHVWSHSFGGLDDDIAYDVAIDTAGRVIVTGVIRDIVSFGNVEHDCTNTEGDVFVLVLDGDGNLEWSRRFGEAGDQEGRGVAVDGQGNIVVVGNMQGSINFGGELLTSAGGSQDVFVAKLAP